MKYSVIIPTYNHCDDLLKPCVESIFKYTNLADIELIISANGCSDNTSLYLDQLRYAFNTLNLANNFKIVWSDTPSGYPKAINDGVKLATTDKIVLLNNDCVFLEQKQNDWLNILDTPFKSNPKCGVSCVVKEHSKVMNYDFAIFFCVMIDRKLFDEIGYLNEEYTPGSGEDMEFCILAQQNGYDICQAYDIKPLDEKYFTGNFPIYHLGEGTVHDKNLVPEWSSVFLRNKFKLAKKYNDEWKKMKIRNDKKVAVITPVYNDIERLFFTIDCVKKQTVDNVTHYIYDDASTDGLEKGMEELLQDSSIVYVKGLQNLGQSYARNTLIQKAINDGCDYIAFLDSDDSWTNDHLEKSLVNLVDNDIVYSKPVFVGKEGVILQTVNIPIPNIFIGKHLLHNNYIWISSVVAKKECFTHNVFDTNLNSVEDWDMWIRLYQQGFKFVDKQTTTTHYLVKENSQASIGVSKYPLLKQKHQMLDKLRLHLACGHDYTEGFINVDFYAPDDAVCDVRFDVMELPYPDNSVDEIKAFHIIEHFDFFEIQKVLKEWNRVLKPGGRLWLETPDFLESCRSFVDGSPTMHIEDWRVLLYNHFFAHAWIPGQTHKFLFTETQLRTNLEWAGFTKSNRSEPASKYVRPDTYHLFLNMEAFKDNSNINLSFLKKQNEEIYNEIIEDNIYQVNNSFFNEKYIIDIGANIGIFSLLAASNNAKKVLAFEPVNNTFKLLCDNILKSNLKNIEPIKKAVYKVTGDTVKINLQKNDGHNSLYDESINQELVETISLNDVLKDFENNVILKIDCEGSEYDILLNVSNEEMQKVETVLMEIHGNVHPNFKGFDIIHDKMNYFGFKMKDFKQIYSWDIDENGNKINYQPIPCSVEVWTR